jgi:hypothetical protein
MRRSQKPDKSLARLTVTLGHQDYREVCQLAEQNDVSAAWVIRRAVQQYLQGAGQPGRDETAGRS